MNGKKVFAQRYLSSNIYTCTTLFWLPVLMSVHELIGTMVNQSRTHDGFFPNLKKKYFLIDDLLEIKMDHDNLFQICWKVACCLHFFVFVEVTGRRNFQYCHGKSLFAAGLPALRSSDNSSHCQLVSSCSNI